MNATATASGDTLVGHDIHAVTPCESPKPEADANHAAHHAEHDGLDEELHQHIAPARADGQPQANLTRPLRDRDQHDVHDADAADQQRDAGNACQQGGHGFGGLHAHAGHFFHRADHEVVFIDWI